MGHEARNHRNVTLRRASFASPLALLLVLAGCGGGDRARPSPSDLVDAALSRGESGFISLLSTAECEEMDEIEGLMRITGAPGASATLQLSCGGTVYDECTATVGSGSSAAACRTEEQEPVGSGVFSCSQRVELGSPSVAGTCFQDD